MWCGQVIGLARAPASPVRAMPVSSSPAAAARAARHRPYAATAAAIGSQSSRLGSSGATRRLIRPSSDWLPV